MIQSIQMPRVDTYGEKEIWITIQGNDSPGIEPLPHLLHSLLSRESFELDGAFLVDGFWLEEEAQ
jgi:hypothetical protein